MLITRNPETFPLAVIRKLARSRWRDYKKLRLESLARSPLAFGSSLEEEIALKENEWKKRMRNAYFALDGEKLVGMVACNFNKEVKFRHIAEIYSLYVRPGERGRGTGTSLLDHALLLAAKNPEILKVRLYVNDRQHAALSMYRKAGFEQVGSLDREMKVGLRYYTMLVMEKKVR